MARGKGLVVLAQIRRSAARWESQWPTSAATSGAVKGRPAAELAAGFLSSLTAGPKSFLSLDTSCVIAPPGVSFFNTPNRPPDHDKKDHDKRTMTKRPWQNASWTC